MGKRQEQEHLKQALVVFGALAFGWATIELAFKPLLDMARAAMDKSDPARDPDDTSAPAPAPTETKKSTDDIDASAAAEASSSSTAAATV